LWTGYEGVLEDGTTEAVTVVVLLEEMCLVLVQVVELEAAAVTDGVLAWPGQLATSSLQERTVTVVLSVRVSVRVWATAKALSPTMRAEARILKAMCSGFEIEDVYCIEVENVLIREDQ
jgi:hypothetical protein